MRQILLTCFAFGIFALGAGASTEFTCAAQAPPSVRQEASVLLTELSQAFSAGRVIQRVQLSGTAVWYGAAGQESGDAVLTASADGSSKVALSLNASGERMEMQSSAGVNSTCSWSGSDGITHQSRSTSCWRPVVWFLPALSLQPSTLSTAIATLDSGTVSLGAAASSVRDLKAHLVLSGETGDEAEQTKRESSTDIGLDPKAWLPTLLRYSVRPDDGAPVFVSIEVRYSDYHLIEGVAIPFRIERVTNGSPDLTIEVNSAVIN